MQLQTSLVKGAFTASIPVCMGYIPLGIVFGFLCVQAGAPWWIPPISSILIYGGAALADAVMGITGASVGEVVQTLSFNINFISNLPGTGTAIVKSQVKHHGQTTMVIMAEMTDEQNNLLAAITTTMFIAGHFNEIPREW